MRIVQTSVITENIKEMCIEANHYLSKDMKAVLDQAVENEKASLGKQILNQLEENLRIAAEDMIPICQDTGMAVIFLEIGQDIHFEGSLLEDAVNEGVRQGYEEGFLRKSVVKDPLIRENTKDNTPAVIHYEIVSGDKAYSGTERIWQREHEPYIYAEAGGRHRRGKRSDFDCGKRGGPKRLSAYGNRCGNRGNI